MSVDLAELERLAERWREDAERLRAYGADRLATACEKHADELEERLREWSLELLTLEEAARETGLAYDTIQRKVAADELPNAGEKGRPRVRRFDLHPWLEAPEPPRAKGPVEELAETTLRAREGS